MNDASFKQCGKFTCYRVGKYLLVSWISFFGFAYYLYIFFKKRTCRRS